MLLAAMEGRLKMKLTDFCILFGMILVGLFISNDLKLKAVNETMISEMLLNKNMDEIVVDGLDAGFTGIDADDEPIVDLDVATNHIFEEMSLLFYGKNDMEGMAKKYVKGLIFVDKNGYSVYEEGQWSREREFDSEMSHSDRIELITRAIEEKAGEVTLISYNDGESYKNTIDDNTLIIVYCGYNFMTNEFVYKNCYLSAASIAKKK